MLQKPHHTKVLIKNPPLGARGQTYEQKSNFNNPRWLGNS
jgi:hypothetical protein